MEEEFQLDGGIAGKLASNPKLDTTPKYGCIGVSMSNPPDPEKAKIFVATDFNEALKKLQVEEYLSILNIHQEPLEFKYKINNQADLTEKGMVDQIPVQQELFEKQQALHKLHEQLTNSYRTQQAVERLLADASKKEALINFLRLAANKLSPQN